MTFVIFIERLLQSSLAVTISVFPYLSNWLSLLGNKFDYKNGAGFPGKFSLYFSMSVLMQLCSPT